MSRKAKITIEIECTAPKEFFSLEWDDMPEEHQITIAEQGPLICGGTGVMSTHCAELFCRWLGNYEEDIEPC